ncbi:MAG: DUF6624 domain-containing protein [Planctomycetota bacterium]
MAFKCWVCLVLLTLVGACQTPFDSRRSVVESVRWHDDFQAGLAVLDDSVERESAWLSSNADVTPPTEELRRLVRRDELVAEAWGVLLPPVPNHARSWCERQLVRRLHAVRVENADRLRAMLVHVGWFTRSEFGAQADRDAWTIVQHADHLPAWQAEMLTVLEGLAEVGESDPALVAYLHDRVAVSAGRPQRYGTQGGCVYGRWEPEPIEDRDAVDARRAAVGLPPLAEQLAEATRACN